MTKFKFLIDDDLDLTINSFIEHCMIMNSSKISYRMATRLFLNWLIKQGITEPDKQDIIDYKLYLGNKNLSVFTVHVYLNSIRMFFRWLHNIGHYPNIANGVFADLYPKEKFYKKHLTAYQIKKLLNSIDKSNLKGLRDFSIINLMCRTGVRCIECARANVEDIRKEGGEVRLYLQGKGRKSKDEFILLTESAFNPINDFLRVRFAVGSMNISNEPLFPSLGNRNKYGRLTSLRISILIKKYLQEAGFTEKGYSAHSLRHSAVSLAVQAGCSIFSVSKMTKHANPAITNLYNHHINSDEISPENAIDKLLIESN